VTGATSVSAEGAGIPGERVGEDRHRLTPAERARIWEQATAAAATATEQVSAVTAAADPGAAADAAWAASDFLSAAARVVEGRRGGPLTAAAGEYDRAPGSCGRVPEASDAGKGLRAALVPEASDAGKGLRAALVLLASARFVGRGESKQLLALLAQLAALSDAVTRLRETQDRAVQAAAARRAAEGVRIPARSLASVHAGSPAATAPRTRRPGVADVEDDRRRQGPTAGAAARHGEDPACKTVTARTLMRAPGDLGDQTLAAERAPPPPVVVATRLSAAAWSAKVAYEGGPVGDDRVYSEAQAELDVALVVASAARCGRPARQYGPLSSRFPAAPGGELRRAEGRRSSR